MKTQSQPHIINCQLGETEFSKFGFIIFRQGAPDEEACLGFIKTKEAGDALAKAKLRWPVYADEILAIDFERSAHLYEFIEHELSHNPWPHAYHQAGYVMAARHFGWPVIAVSLRPKVHSVHGVCYAGMLSFGATDLAEHDLIPNDEREADEQLSIYYLAGAAAEFRFEPHNENWDLCVDSLMIPEWHSDGCEVTYYESLRARAKRLVECYWASIEKIACALVERHSLISADLDAVLSCGKH